MFEVREKPKMVEHALLIGVQIGPGSEEEMWNHVEELGELVNTLGIDVEEKMVIKVKKAQPRFLIGSGKAEEIMHYAKEKGYDCIVFDDPLTPGQQRNWEQESKLCVIDRQEVILDIFADRAQTREAVLQVALARMVYSLPRLTRAWTHLSRQRGGGTNMRGQGETQLEADQRLVRDRIASLKRKLEDVRAQRATQRKRRMKKPVPSTAIVGYTNAGKSSLLNQLTGASILAEDKLFATLDPTTRQLLLPSGQKLLLTDTVGFVRKLPHNLVEAFKATLEEAIVADFLIHVLDVSSPDVDQHMETTLSVLKELGADEKQIVTVFNKTDLAEDPYTIPQLKARFPDAHFVSVVEDEGLTSLIDTLDSLLDHHTQWGEYRFPFDRYDLISKLHNLGCVKEEKHEDEGVYIAGFIPEQVRSSIESFRILSE